jgi:hypothetical protein
MSELETLPEAIPADPQILSEDILIELWDRKWFLILFLALIGTEWFLRKLWSLL